jgi:serine/threonine-protein kinase RsbW
MHRDGHRPATAGPTGDLDYSEVPAEAGRLPELRHALARWAHSIGLAAEQVEALTLASYEALANTVTHAYPDGRTGTLDLSAQYLPHRRLVEVIVTDHGRWSPPPPGPRLLGGRGLPLIHRLAESAHVDPTTDGTAVHMFWSLQTAPRSRS